jgi:hypothetical protein
MERLDSGIEERAPHRLLVRVGDLEDATIVAPDSSDPRASERPSLSARVNQFPNRSRKATPPAPSRKCTVFGSIPASASASANALHGGIRSEGSYDGVPRGGVKLDPGRCVVIDVGTWHGTPVHRASGRSGAGSMLTQLDRGASPAPLSGLTNPGFTPCLAG